MSDVQMYVSLDDVRCVAFDVVRTDTLSRSPLAMEVEAEGLS